MTFKRAAETANEVQDACNLSGVLFSFANIMREIICVQAQVQSKGTDWRNRHPIVFLFNYKLMALNGYEPMDLDLGDKSPYRWAEAECKRMAETLGADSENANDWPPYNKIDGTQA